MSTRKDVEQLVQSAEKQGWTVIQVKSGHRKWLSPNGGVVFTSFTPSDRKALFRIKKDLKLHGFIEVKTQRRRNA